MSSEAAETRRGFLFYAVCAGLCLLTWVLYFPVLKYPFVYLDDDVYVSSNPHVMAGINWESIKWAFSAGDAGMWHPLTWLSHITDAQIWKLVSGGHHLTNVLLHIGSTAVLFTLFHRMTRALWSSALVAALFAWHPLHVESVAWISERKDVLSTFFALLSIVAYIGYTEKRSAHVTETAASQMQFFAKGWFHYSASLLFFALSLASKPMLVTLPCVLLLLDYWPLNRWTRERINIRQLILEKVPYAMLTAAVSVVAYVFQAKVGATARTGDLALHARLANAVLSYCAYLGKTFWPSKLAVFYPLPNPPVFNWWFALAAAVLLVAFSLFALIQRRWPYLTAGWFWYLGTLVPVIGIIQVGHQSMADRFTYVPLIGIFIVIAWALKDYATGPRVHSVIPATCAGLALVGCLVRSHYQIQYWSSNKTLFERAVAITSNNDVALNALGRAFIDEGKTNDALLCFSNAFRISHDPVACNNFAGALYSQGNYPAAVKYFSEAVQLKPDYAEAYGNLGLALKAEGRNVEAARAYAKAASLRGDLATLNNLAATLAEHGATADALDVYREMVQLQPGSADMHYNLGTMLASEGKSNEATKELREAVRLDPAHVMAQNNLGRLLLESGQLDEAAAHLKTAIELAPTNPRIHFNFGSLLIQQGKLSEAKRELTEALRLDPTFTEAQDQLRTLESGKPGSK